MRKDIALVAALLLVSVILLIILTPHFTGNVVLNSFSNGAPTKTITFTKAGWDNTTAINVPKGADIFYAYVVIHPEQVNGQYPTDVKIDVGGNGVDWTHTGPLVSDQRIRIDPYIGSLRGNVPIHVYSSTPGKIVFENLVVSYAMPISLNNVKTISAENVNTQTSSNTVNTQSITTTNVVTQVATFFDNFANTSKIDLNASENITVSNGIVSPTAPKVNVTTSWTYSGWKYRTQLNVYNPNSENLTNFQVELTVPYKTGMNSNFSDIRFATVSGTQVPYWIENYTPNENATVWIKVPYMPANGTTILYMYYGNPNAVSESNGSNVFLFFDNFSTMDNEIFTKNTHLVTSPAFVGNSSIELIGNTGSTEGIMREISMPSSGIYAETMYIYLTNVTEGHLFAYSTVDQIDTSSWVGPHVTVGHTGVSSDGTVVTSDLGYLMYHTSTSGWVSTGYKFPINQWVKLTIYINLGSQRFNLSVNDQNIITNGVYHQTGIRGTTVYEHTDIDGGVSTFPNYYVGLKYQFKYAPKKPIAVFSNSNAPWTYSDWKYRIPVSIVNTGSNLTNFQVELTVPYKTGMNSNFSDIRFATVSGTQVPYWIENYTPNENATVWIKVPYMPANGTTILYMYYGNPNAVSESNGSNVFLFFDDFNGKINSAWIQSGVQSLSFSNSTVTINTNAPPSWSRSGLVWGPLPTPSTIEAYGGIVSADAEFSIINTNNPFGNSYTVWTSWQKQSSAWEVRYEYSSDTYGGITSSFSNSSSLLRFDILNDNSVGAYINGKYIGVLNVVSLTNKYLLIGSDRAATSKWDWVFVRSYSSSKITSFFGGVQSKNAQSTAYLVSAPITANITKLLSVGANLSGTGNASFYLLNPTMSQKVYLGTLTSSGVINTSSIDLPFTDSGDHLAVQLNGVNITSWNVTYEYTTTKTIVESSNLTVYPPVNSTFYTGAMFSFGFSDNTTVNSCWVSFNGSRLVGSINKNLCSISIGVDYPVGNYSASFCVNDTLNTLVCVNKTIEITKLSLSNVTNLKPHEIEINESGEHSITAPVDVPMFVKARSTLEFNGNVVRAPVIVKNNTVIRNMGWEYHLHKLLISMAANNVNITNVSIPLVPPSSKNKVVLTAVHIKNNTATGAYAQVNFTVPTGYTNVSLWKHEDNGTWYQLSYTRVGNTIISPNITTFSDLIVTADLVDWPTFHHDNARTGYTTALAPLNPVVSWNFTVPGMSYQYLPIVSNDIVYFVDGNYTLSSTSVTATYALNATTGQQLWNTSLSGDNTFAFPVVSNGILYVGTDANVTYALNATTGQQLWNFTTINGSPFKAMLVSDGILYFGTSSSNFVNYLYALNATTGQQLWNFTAAGPASPSIYNGILYFGTAQGNMFYALNATTGQQLWNFTLSSGNRVPSAPMISNGVVYVGTSLNTTYALNATTGQQLWNFTTSGSIDTPAIANGILYFGTSNSTTDYLYALNATTGQQLWNFTTNDWIDNSPAISNDVIYFMAGNTTYALNATTGQQLWNLTFNVTDPSSLSIYDGKLYFVALNGPDPSYGMILYSISGSLCPPDYTGLALYAPDSVNAGLNYTINGAFCVNGQPVSADFYKLYLNSTALGTNKVVLNSTDFEPSLQYNQMTNADWAALFNGWQFTSWQDPWCHDNIFLCTFVPGSHSAYGVRVTNIGYLESLSKSFTNVSATDVEMDLDFPRNYVYSSSFAVYVNFTFQDGKSLIYSIVGNPPIVGTNNVVINYNYFGELYPYGYIHFNFPIKVDQLKYFGTYSNLSKISINTLGASNTHSAGFYVDNIKILSVSNVSSVSQNSFYLNTTAPLYTGNYSILGYADYLSKLYSANKTLEVNPSGYISENVTSHILSPGDSLTITGKAVHADGTPLTTTGGIPVYLVLNGGLFSTTYTYKTDNFTSSLDNWSLMYGNKVTNYTLNTVSGYMAAFANESGNWQSAGVNLYKYYNYSWINNVSFDIKVSNNITDTCTSLISEVTLKLYVDNNGITMPYSFLLYNNTPVNIGVNTLYSPQITYGQWSHVSLNDIYKDMRLFKGKKIVSMELEYSDHCSSNGMNVLMYMDVDNFTVGIPSPSSSLNASSEYQMTITPNTGTNIISVSTVDPVTGAKIENTTYVQVGPMSIKMLKPTFDQHINGIINVSLDAGESMFNNVKLYVNDTLVNSSSLPELTHVYNISFNSENYQTGYYNVSVVVSNAYATASNWTIVYIDNTAPTVTLNFPREGNNYVNFNGNNGVNTTINATINDVSGVSSVIAYIDNSSEDQVTSVTLVKDGNYYINNVTLNLSEPYTISIYSADDLGNSNYTLPVAFVLYPANVTIATTITPQDNLFGLHLLSVLVTANNYPYSGVVCLNYTNATPTYGGVSYTMSCVNLNSTGGAIFVPLMNDALPFSYIINLVQNTASNILNSVIAFSTSVQGERKYTSVVESPSASIPISNILNPVQSNYEAFSMAFTCLNQNRGISVQLSTSSISTTECYSGVPMVFNITNIPEGDTIKILSSNVLATSSLTTPSNLTVVVKKGATNNYVTIVPLPKYAPLTSEMNISIYNQTGSLVYSTVLTCKLPPSSCSFPNIDIVGSSALSNWIQKMYESASYSFSQVNKG